MKHIVLFVLTLLAATMTPAYSEGTRPPSSTRPALTGHLAIGGGTEAADLTGDRPTSLGVEVKLRLANAVGPVSLNASCRHFLDDDPGSFWRGKSKLNLGFDVPLGPDAVFFGEHERKYYGGESWSWAGVRWTFSAH